MSGEITDIEDEITRLKTLSDNARTKKNLQQYQYFSSRVQDLGKNLAALKECERRLDNLESP